MRRYSSALALSAALLCSVTTVSAQAPERNESARLFPVKVGDRWGLVDRDGRIVLPAEFESLREERDGTYRPRQGGKEGIVAANGVKIVSPSFDYIGPFGDNGFALGELNRTPVVVDRNGDIVLGPGFRAILPFDGDRLFAVQDGTNWGVVSRDCEWLLEPAFARIGPVAGNGLAGAQLATGQAGFIDRAGNWVISPERFEDVRDFAADGLAPAKSGGKWGFIDTEGNWAIEPIDENRYWHPMPFGQEGVTAINLDGKQAVMDRSGAIVIPPQYDRIGPIAAGGVYVESDGKEGFLDLQGNVLVPLEYDRITSFGNEGLARANRGGHWSIIDRSGRDVFGDRFELVGTFEDRGWAAARKNGRWGAIDPSGEWLLPPEYDCVESCYDGVAAEPPPIMVRMLRPDELVAHPDYVTRPREQAWCRLPR